MQRIFWRLIIFFLGHSLLIQANATEYKFSSSLDHFTVNVESGSATFDGKSVSGEPFAYVKPLFETETQEECPSGLKKPDLTITRTKNGVEQSRKIYISDRIVSDGKLCASVTGQGLYKLPLHRNWFSEKKTVSIGLGEEFSIWKDNKMVVAFERRKDGQFRNKDPKFFTNWTFFEKFTAAIKDFPISFRVHEAAAKEETKFELRQSDRKFLFVKVGEKTWAVRFPGSPWFAVSNQFGAFDEMNPNTWISPFSRNLSVAADTTADLETRRKAISALKMDWSPDVKVVFYDLLLSSHEPTEIKLDIVQFLKFKPTDENFKILVDSLRTTTDSSLLEVTTRVLRVRNPKGPLIVVDETPDVQSKKIDEWIAWRRSLKNN